MPTNAMLGTTEIILIIVAILLLFGAKRLPGLIKGAAKGVRDFKKELNEDNGDGGGPDKGAKDTSDRE